MASDMKQPVLVQAVYSFKGKNNDELCFKKGDIISVTQVEEGGWWEGTLGDKTGWFPSNYVEEYRTEGECVNMNISAESKLSIDLLTQQKANRAIIVKDLIDSEKAHVTELQILVNKFLLPIQHSEVLTNDEYNQLMSNILQALDVQEKLLKNLEELTNIAPNEQRIGRLFLHLAPKIKQVYELYCISHPYAVLVLNKYKDELGKLMESNGATSPGILVLTTGLSKPFRRLDKYIGMLQELERYIEENHVDRGDIQRSISIYKDITRKCSMVRCQKEMELEVLHGAIRGWEGEDLSSLGEILYMGSVAIGPDYRDRYFVLFPSTLLIVSVSNRMSSFIYEGMLPLTGINVNKLEDSSSPYKNAFEITGNLIDKIVAVCQTKEDQQEWIKKLSHQINVTTYKTSAAYAQSPPTSCSFSTMQTNSVISQSSVSFQPVPPPHACIPIKINNGESTTHAWSISNLRPPPPVHINCCIEEKHFRNISNSSERTFAEDAQILQVIESYCTSTKSHYTINSAHSQAAKSCNRWTLVENESNLSDPCEMALISLVKEMKDEIRGLNNKMQNLESHLHEERISRIQLQNYMLKQATHSSIASE